MTPKGLIIAALAALPDGERATVASMRVATGLKSGELQQAIQSLRYAGKLEWDRLALTASMRAAAMPAPDVQVVASEPIDMGVPVSISEGKASPLQPFKRTAPLYDEARHDALSFLVPARPDERELGVTRAVAAGFLGDIDAYCARTGIAETLLGRLLFDFGGFVGLLRRRLMVRPSRIRAMHAFMAWAPDGCTQADFMTARTAWLEANAPKLPPLAAKPAPVAPAYSRPASSVAAAVRAEALESSGRAAQARCTGTVKSPLPAHGPSARLSLGSNRPFDGASLQELAIETPQDLAQALTRRWGPLWARLCADARAHEVRPIPHMVAMMERALGFVPLETSESEAA